MRELVGSPGTWGSLVLRAAQCSFAGASIGVMASAMGFSNYTAFWYCVWYIPCCPIFYFFFTCYTPRNQVCYSFVCCNWSKIIQDRKCPVLVSDYIFERFYQCNKLKRYFANKCSLFVFEKLSKSDHSTSVCNAPLALNRICKKHYTVWLN